MAEDSAGRYRIERQLGRGGMGEVWLARDIRLDRLVALKVLPDTGSDEDAGRRLMREAKSLAALDHPFICKTYEAGELENRPFIAMEYVEGSTLRSRLDGGPLPLREALRLGAEIAEALDYAHRRGIVHRDLKPSNVMLTPEGHVKLLDFGIARRMPALVGGLEETRSMTLSDGAMCGTLAYMSPEQLEGSPADAQSDIFAFGLLFHEMLTGSHPFERSTPAATAGAILSQPLPALTERLSQAPPVLEHIVRRMLAKERATRYQSAREIRADLATVLESPSGGGATTGRRDWRLAIPVAAAILLAIAVLVFTDWLRVEQPALAFKERDWVLIADFENLTGDTAFDRPLQAALALAVEQSQHVNVVPQARVRDALRRMQRANAAALDVDLASEMAIRESVRAVIAGSVAQVGEQYVLTARIIDPNSRTAVVTESARAKARSDVLSALDDLGKRIRRRLGESLDGIARQSRPLPLATTGSIEALNVFVESRGLAGADAQKQISLLRQALALDPEFAMAHADLGFALYLRNARTEGESHFVRALSLLDRLTTREQLWIRALAADTRGHREQAAVEYESYLTQYPDDASAWFRLGWTRMAGLGQPEKGAEAFKRVLAIHPSDASAQVNLATCYAGLRREREAVAEYEKAFQLQPDLRTAIFVNHEYGFTLVRIGEFDKAAAAFRTMIDQQERGLQARGRRSLALLEMYRGRFAAAEAELREAILLNRALKSGLSEFRDRLFLATVLETRGMAAAAREEVAAAGRIGAAMALAPGWLHMLGKAYARRGQVREAERLLANLPAAHDPTAASGVNRSTNRDDASGRLLRGEVALAGGRAADALSEFEVAYRIHPDSDSLEARATAYLALKRRDEAAAALRELIDRHELGRESQQEWLLAHLRLGELYESEGKTAEAAKLYGTLETIWIDADPDLSVVRQLRGRLKRVAAR